MTFEVVEIPSPYNWIRKVYLGPSAALPSPLEDYIDACRRFEMRLKALKRPAASSLFDWWINRVEQAGDIPAKDEKWIIELARFAPLLFVRERVGDTETIRYRYVGKTAEEKFGATLTLMNATEFGGLDETENFRILSPLFLDGCFFFSWLDYSQVSRSFVKATAIELPLRDPRDGTIRYSIGAMDYDS